jgi:hypothetical protein
VKPIEIKNYKAITLPRLSATDKVVGVVGVSIIFGSVLALGMVIAFALFWSVVKSIVN